MCERTYLQQKTCAQKSDMLPETNNVLAKYRCAFFLAPDDRDLVIEYCLTMVTF